MSELGTQGMGVVRHYLREMSPSFHSTASVSDRLPEHAGDVHITATGLDQKKGLWSYRLLPPGGMRVAGPQKSILEFHSSMLAQINGVQIDPPLWPFFASDLLNPCEGSVGNLCMTSVLLYTNPKKRSPQGASPDGNVV